MSDFENQEQLLRLMRYHTTLGGNLTSCSLDDYIKSMKEGQKKIYYISGSDPERVNSNPFMEPFKGSDVPVLIVTNQLDEMVFQNIGTFKGLNFVNVESGYEEIAKDLGDKDTNEGQRSLIPEEDVTPFCLWLKENTKPFVGKVSVSKRLKDVPVVLFGQMSSNMRAVMHMM